MKIKVLSPVRHDGVFYGEGQEVEIKVEAVAKVLIDLGAAEEVKASKAAQKAEKPADKAAE